MPDTPEFEPHVIMARKDQDEEGDYFEIKHEPKFKFYMLDAKPLLTVTREQAEAEVSFILLSDKYKARTERARACVDFMCSVRVEQAPQSPVTLEEACEAFAAARGLIKESVNEHMRAGLRAVLALCASRGVKQAAETSQTGAEQRIAELESIIKTGKADNERLIKRLNEDQIEKQRLKELLVDSERFAKYPMKVTKLKIVIRTLAALLAEQK